MLYIEVELNKFSRLPKFLPLIRAASISSSVALLIDCNSRQMSVKCSHIEIRFGFLFSINEYCKSPLFTKGKRSQGKSS